MISSDSKNWSVVIAAAGKGSRSGLDYPKTLFNIQNKPILVHLYQTLEWYDNCPTIIVSPEGYQPIFSCLNSYKLSAELVEQSIPRGMGDAVLQIYKSENFEQLKDIILVWGDIPFLQKNTVDILLEKHVSNKNQLSFATIFVDEAYTRVLRDENGKVLEVIETRQTGDNILYSGERDIGLFVFDKNIILTLLQEDCSYKYGQFNQEHGFLYLVKFAVSKGYKVGAYPCAHPLDLISFNKQADIKDFI